MQTFTFYASEDKLDNRGNECASKYGVKEINDAACRLAHEVANEGDALVAGGISQTPAYLSGLGKEKVQAEFKKQVDSFVANKVDFLIAEYFEHVEEIEWAIEALKKYGNGMAVCANMCIVVIIFDIWSVGWRKLRLIDNGCSKTFASIDTDIVE